MGILPIPQRGPHNPAIQFDVECEFHGLSAGHHIVQVVALANNKGHVEHRFRRITVTIRGINDAEQLQYVVGHEPRLAFPHELARFENLVSDEAEYYFVRPGVLQPFRAVTMIDRGYTHVLVRADFEYEATGDMHQAERVFAVPHENCAA